MKAGVLYKDESYRIIGACFEVYNELGPGFLEAVYQECLAREFKLAVKQLIDDHRAQVINYLKSTKLKLGLLVNFGHYPDLQYERFVNDLRQSA